MAKDEISRGTFSFDLPDVEMTAEQLADAFRAAVPDGHHVIELEPTAAAPDTHILAFVQDGHELSTEDRIRLRLMSLELHEKQNREGA